MQIALMVVLVVLALVILALQAVLLRRSGSAHTTDPGPTLDRVESAIKQLPTATTYREEAAAARREQADTARTAREEHAKAALEQRHELSAKFDSS